MTLREPTWVLDDAASPEESACASACRACIEANESQVGCSQGLLPCNIRLARTTCDVYWDCKGPVHTFTPVSKRPLGVSMMKDGGLKGYSGGSSMRPW